MYPLLKVVGLRQLPELSVRKADQVVLLSVLILMVLQQIHMSMYVHGHKQVEEQVLERFPVVLLQSKEITESVLLIIILLLLL